MGKLFVFAAGGVAGAIGWWLTAPFGIMTAFIASTVATGFGMYYGGKWAREHLP